MVKPAKTTLAYRLKCFIIGDPIDPTNKKAFHSITLAAFFAWVGLGSDGLSSSAYGPEEAFLALGGHTHLAILIAIASAVTVLLISASYAQLIEVFPSGGGGYLVASKLISPTAGMISGCALIIDYVLTITISIASAADAVFSFVPPQYLHYKMGFSLAALILLTVLNMRGARETVMPLVPIFLIFVLSHAFAIVYALGTHLLDFPAVAAETATQAARTHSELGLLGMAFLLLRAFSMGAGTYTGIEAVSNGLSILREPKVKTGKRTMLYMAVSLAFTVFGLTLAYLLFKVEHAPGKTLNAVLFESISSSWPGSSGTWFVYTALISEALILFAAAQAGFMGGPRVLANMALDKWFPTRFSLLSDRLVTQNGIFIMGAASVATMILTKGSVKYLVVLYSITVFVTFVLSQLGMVRYWLRNRRELDHWRRKLAVNGAGLALCSFILIAVTVLKFRQGGWITLVITGALIALAFAIKGHYNFVEKVLKRMDNLVAIAKSKESGSLPKLMGAQAGAEAKFDPKAKTAVLLVNGFNGIGLHSLLAIIRMFGGIFKNIVFVEVGVLDAGSFKGAEEVENLQKHVREELDQYVEFVKRNGIYAEGIMSLSPDVVEGTGEVAAGVIERFPQAIFFMGQLVFPEETIFSRLLHNNTVFAVQRRLYHKGIPFIILPIRINLKKKK
ncbi:MAG TPA: APC family permease [Fibrobacteria bacterium]|nr:APC family permease [Fibrobacteria bacterium]